MAFSFFSLTSVLPERFYVSHGDFWLCTIFKVFVSLIVKIAFVLGVCNLISVVACCDSLYVRINFDVKKTATGHKIAES